MVRAEYITIQIYIIPQELIVAYNFKAKVHNGYIFAWVTKVIYGLPHAEQVVHDALFHNPSPHRYYHSSKTPELWTHDSLPNNIALVVHSFGVKYPVKEHAQHLKATLEDKYKVTPEWEVKLYNLISCQWDY